MVGIDHLFDCSSALDAIDAAYKTVAVGGEAGSHIAVGTSVTKVSQNSECTMRWPQVETWN
jgi:hypothetical protein